MTRIPLLLATANSIVSIPSAGDGSLQVRYISPQTGWSNVRFQFLSKLAMRRTSKLVRDNDTGECFGASAQLATCSNPFMNIIHPKQLMSIELVHTCFSGPVVC